MDAYAASGANNVTPVPGDTVVSVEGIATKRGRVHYIMVGAYGVPVADNIIQWLIRRTTDLGTRTAVVPTPLDMAGPASQLTAGENHTAEPTVTTTLFDLAVHQRSSFQWYAVPGKELVIPAVALSGIAITPIHAAYAGLANAILHWTE